MKKTIPDYVLKNTKTFTVRAFKSKKRKEIKDALFCVNKIKTACVFIPNHDDLRIAEQALLRLQDQCSIKSWGR